MTSPSTSKRANTMLLLSKGSICAGIGFFLVFSSPSKWAEHFYKKQENQETIPRTVGTNSKNIFPLLESSDRISCDSIPEILSEGDLHPSKVNALRRKLMLSDQSCFERHVDLFGQLFLSRFPQKHVMLDIPKCGGASVCEIVQEEGILSNPGGACWKEDFCPYWCGCTDPKPTTCDQLNSWYADFVMNQNWLDSFCDHHTYSVMVRDPATRTMSHVNNFLNAVANRDGHLFETKNWRLSLIQSNYMTWALSASNEIDMNRSQHFYPKERHLEIATERLMEMDYIIDLSHEDKTCMDYLFENAIKISSPMGDAADSYDNDYAEGDFSLETFEATNSLDIELYKFAHELIKTDCRFIAMMLEIEGAEFSLDEIDPTSA